MVRVSIKSLIRWIRDYWGFGVCPGSGPEALDELELLELAEECVLLPPALQCGELRPKPVEGGHPGHSEGVIPPALVHLRGTRRFGGVWGGLRWKQLGLGLPGWPG